MGHIVAIVLWACYMETQSAEMGSQEWWTEVHTFQTAQFKVMDANGDGDVTDTELEEVVAKLKKRALDAGVDIHEKGADGQPKKWPGFQQFEASLVQKTDINVGEGKGPKDWYKEHAKDKNGDGRFTLDEYLLDKNEPLIKNQEAK